KPTLPEMLKDRTLYRELPLRVSAFTARAGANGLVNVVVVAEPIDSSMAIDTAAFGLVDTNFSFMTLAWPASAESISQSLVVAGGSVPPGPYRLRVAAMSKDGRRGTAEYEFVAGLAKAGPLDLGDLMIGQGQPDGSFGPELVVGDRAAATGYFEMQGT